MFCKRIYIISEKTTQQTTQESAQQTTQESAQETTQEKGRQKFIDEN